ncbi:MAG: chemotaxis protein CheA [Desulfovibrio sp.]
MKDRIEHCLERLEEIVINLEHNPQDMALLAEALSTLGVSHAKFPSAEIITLFDMLKDGITPVSGDIITALLSITDAYRQLLYSIAGVVNNQAEEIAAKQLEIEESIAAEEAIQVATEQENTGSKETDSTETANADKEDNQEQENKRTDVEENAPKSDAKQTDNKGKKQSITSIRVDTYRLDNLIDLIGKLTVTFAIINSTKANDSSSNLMELDHTINQLQKEVDHIRLVPLKQIFMPMHRLVKGLSQKSEKPINFIVQGDDLALDKTIIEMLNEPLVHLLRNAVDHGIEPPEERGEKLEKGQVTLNAHMSGDTAIITVTDDGRGLDPDKIFAKAQKNGLIPEHMERNEIENEDLFKFIFKSGFSTAAEVTDISGRGVGMDAVLHAVEDTLKGDISVQSVVGKGSIFTISLPVGRSGKEGIIDSLICRVGDETFIIPTTDVLEIFIPELTTIVELPDGRETVDIRGQIHPIIRLAKWFGQERQVECAHCQMVLVRNGSLSAAIIVNEVLRQQQVVSTRFTIPVQEIYNIPISGFGMMGETDALTIDIERLLHTFNTDGVRVYDTPTVDVSE